MERLRALLGTTPVPEPAPSTGARQAAVGVLLRPAPDPEILLIRRAERAGDPWSGHMAFPGGIRSPADANLAGTFVRETEEETGITLDSSGSILGALDVVAPASPRLPPIYIAPFVAHVPAATIAIPDEREVVDAFWIPLSFLRDERNAREFLLEIEGATPRRFPSVRFREHVIWGLTHRILAQFLELAAERVGPEPVIMIARCDDDAERRLQFAERRHDLGRRVDMRRAALFADEIARDQHEVGLQAVEVGHDPEEPFGRHIGSRHVDVRQQE